MFHEALQTISLLSALQSIALHGDSYQKALKI
jgi:hypothetical protein